jgi:uncharacterized membrane protein
MAQSKGMMGQLGEMAKNNPAVDRLREEATGYLKARGQDLAKNLGGRIEDATTNMQDAADGGGVLGKTAKGGAKSMAQGENPMKGAAMGAAGGLKDKVMGALGGGGGGGSKALKATIIEEEIDVGASVSVVYNQWTQFQDFSGFMKKVENAELDEGEVGEEAKVNFKAQVLWSHRTWEGTIKEQVPDQRITWRSEGEKGHVDGSVSFHELAPRLTRVIVVLEYYPQGFFERTGNIWRAQGRRARLELKHFRRHVMMNVMHAPEELEGWRAEVHDEEITRSHDDIVEEEEREEDEAVDEGAEGDYDEGPEGEYEEEPDEEPEDEYDEGEYEEESEEEPEDEYDEGEYEEEPGEEPEDEYEDEDEYEEEPEEEEPPRRRRRAS